jgi:hypothetical protein
MPNGSSNPSGGLNRLRAIEFNPLFAVGLGLIVVLGVVYFSWLRPKMDADKALREFNTPEAQAKRDPDQRKVSATLQSKIDAIRAKETHFDSGTLRHRRDE